MRSTAKLSGLPKMSRSSLAQDVLADIDHEIRTDAEDVAVARDVMHLAKGRAVGDDGSALRVVVSEDPGRVQKDGVP